MKTNVSIEIKNDDLVALANLVDGKVTKRRIKRKEIDQLCNQHIGGLIEQANNCTFFTVLEPMADSFASPTDQSRVADLYRVDPEDQAVLAGQPDLYVRGWNKVKRGVMS